MQHCSTLRVLTAALLLASVASAQELASSGISLPTQPALSPLGDRIVFTYQGDLWLASTADGEAMRLTVHDAYDHGALFSPDADALLQRPTASAMMTFRYVDRAAICAG